MSICIVHAKKGTTYCDKTCEFCNEWGICEVEHKEFKNGKCITYKEVKNDSNN